MRCLKIWGLSLLTLMETGSLLCMETVYDTSLNTTYIHDYQANNGLTQVRQYLQNRTNSALSIANTLEQQTDMFKKISNTIADVMPTITLTPTCYLSFEEKNEPSSGKIERTIRGINADGNGLIKIKTITIIPGRNSTFKVMEDENTKNITKKIAHNFNEPLENLIPGIPGHYFILKGKDALDKKTCLHLLKIISQVNRYVSHGTYETQYIPNNINCPSSTVNNKGQNLTTFAQNVYNQANTLKLLHTYKNELSEDNQLKNLTQRLPKDLIAQEDNLIRLQKITTQLKSIYEILHNAQQHNSLLSVALFTDLKANLSQWIATFGDSNTINLYAQEIINKCNNWLPIIKWHDRIEDKSHEDNKNNYVPDNRYANGKISDEPVRYNPNYWLSQCSKQINGLIGQLYKEPHNIPVIHNLYINSPLMIDGFVLKHGIKTPWGNDSSRYELKGKIYIFLPDGNNGWKTALNNNTKQPFCFEKIFTCAINDTIYCNVYEIYHRGIEGENNIINQCYTHDTYYTNDNWFSNNNQNDLAQKLAPIIGQQSPNNNINNYRAEKHNEYNTYTDNFNNFVCHVDDSSLTIWMPPMHPRIWAMQIKLEKPTKHNLL